MKHTHSHRLALATDTRRACQFFRSLMPGQQPLPTPERCSVATQCYVVLRCPTLHGSSKKTCFTEILPNSQEICISLHQVVFSVALDVSSMSTSCGFCTRVGRRAAIPPEMSMWKMCLKPTRHGRRIVEFEIREFFKAFVFVDVSKKNVPKMCECHVSDMLLTSEARPRQDGPRPKWT